MMMWLFNLCFVVCFTFTFGDYFLYNPICLSCICITILVFCTHGVTFQAICFSEVFSSTVKPFAPLGQTIMAT